MKIIEWLLINLQNFRIVEKKQITFNNLERSNYD